jgi:hypothetical protein
VRLLIFLFLLVSSQCFELKILSPQLINVASVLLFGIMFLYVLSNKSKKISSWDIIFAAYLFFSMLNLYFLRGQSILNSMIAYYPLVASYVFYLFLRQQKITTGHIDSVIEVLAIVYSLILITQITINSELFGAHIQSDFYAFKRYTILGWGAVIFAFFRRLRSNFNVTSLLLLSLYFIVIILLQSRMSIITISVISIWALAKETVNRKRGALSVLAFLLLVVFILRVPAVQKVFDDLLVKTEISIDEGDALQRVVTWKYYLNYESSIIQKTFGNGIARYGFSDFGKIIRDNEVDKRLSLDDSSYLYYFFFFGWFGLLIIIMKTYQLVRLKDTGRSHYKLFIVYVSISGVATYTISHFSFLVYIAVCLHGLNTIKSKVNIEDYAKQ